MYVHLRLFSVTVHFAFHFAVLFSALTIKLSSASQPSVPRLGQHVTFGWVSAYLSLILHLLHHLRFLHLNFIFLLTYGKI